MFSKRCAIDRVPNAALLLFFLAEQAKAKTQLNGIDAWIGCGKTRVRNLHVTDFRADIVLAAEEMQAESGAGGEIDARRCFRNFGIGKERAAANFEIGDHAARRVQRPFERERIYAHAVGGVRFLNDQEERNGVHGIFQAAAQETGAVRPGENQAVTEADVPDAVTGLAAAEAVAAAGPDLQLVSSLDGAGLSANCRCNQE